MTITPKQALGEARQGLLDDIAALEERIDANLQNRFVGTGDVRIVLSWDEYELFHFLREKYRSAGWDVDHAPEPRELRFSPSNEYDLL